MIIYEVLISRCERYDHLSGCIVLYLTKWSQLMLQQVLQLPYNQEEIQQIINMQKDNKNDQAQDMPQLNRKKSSTINQCDICLEQFHILGKWPMIACPNIHYFCDQCIKKMLGLNNDQPTPCPICRALIKKSLIQPHVKLFRSINSQETVKKALKQQNQQSNLLFLYAFQHQIFEIATLFKEGKLEELNKIQKLNLSNRKINKIQHLFHLQSLAALHLQNNMLQSIEGLQNFPNLKILNLNHNNITNIDMLGFLPTLQNLAVQFNEIKEINLMNFDKLRHFFLFGNPLGGTIIDMFLMIEFPILTTLSFSIQDKGRKMLHTNFISSLMYCENLPSLKRLICQELFTNQEQESLQKQAQPIYGTIKLLWINSKNITTHQKWINEFYQDRHIYGQTFKFVADPSSPHILDYELVAHQITKKTANFTSINSVEPIPKQGKQSLKFKVVHPSQHFFVGISNAFVKHNINIYSEHFIGLTFWGSIYSRGDCIPVTYKLKYEEKPLVRMSLDFEQKIISWYFDEQIVGSLPIPQQFHHSELYCHFGMRDTDTAIEIIYE